MSGKKQVCYLCGKGLGDQWARLLVNEVHKTKNTVGHYAVSEINLCEECRGRVNDALERIRADAMEN